MKKILLLITTALFLVSCGAAQQTSTDIINPDAEFLYFYGATCPHCQDLNAMLAEWDLISQISVEKREVYYNEVNQESFLAVGEKLGLPERERGTVPFVLNKVTGEHVTGVTGAFEMLTSNLNLETTSEEEIQEKEELTESVVEDAINSESTSSWAQN